MVRQTQECYRALQRGCVADMARTWKLGYGKSQVFCSQLWNFYSPSVAAWPWGLLGLDSPINSVGADLPPGHEKPYHPNNPSPVYFGELGEPHGLVGTSHVWGSSKEVWKIMGSLSTFRMIFAPRNCHHRIKQNNEGFLPLAEECLENADSASQNPVLFFFFSFLNFVCHTHEGVCIFIFEI